MNPTPVSVPVVKDLVDRDRSFLEEMMASIRGIKEGQERQQQQINQLMSNQGLQ